MRRISLINKGGDLAMKKINFVPIIFFALLLMLSCDKNSPTDEDDPIEKVTVTDIDGNVYQVVIIGNQWWMKENLKVTHYRNGDAIPNVTDNREWLFQATGAYCNYENNVNHVDTYGRLYNWHAVNDSLGIAPEGWHVPTNEDWKELLMFLGMGELGVGAMGWRGTDEGGKLKEGGTMHWHRPNEGATNQSGFTALPGGHRTMTGIFDSLRYNVSFWSSTESVINQALSRALTYTSSKINHRSKDKRSGFLIRCVRD
jgi:uncharacterized protein (TIGR02145 family)